MRMFGEDHTELEDQSEDEVINFVAECKCRSLEECFMKFRSFSVSFLNTYEAFCVT